MIMHLEFFRCDGQSRVSQHMLRQNMCALALFRLRKLVTSVFTRRSPCGWMSPDFTTRRCTWVPSLYLMTRGDWKWCWKDTRLEDFSAVCRISLERSGCCAMCWGWTVNLESSVLERKQELPPLFFTHAPLFTGIYHHHHSQPLPPCPLLPHPVPYRSAHIKPKKDEWRPPSMLRKWIRRARGARSAPWAAMWAFSWLDLQHWADRASNHCSPW